VKRADALERRIEAIFEALRFEIVDGPGSVLVEEAEKEGFARITCHFGKDARAIRWKLQTGDLRPIASEKNADGAILVVRADGALEAHVMECKQKVDSSTWRKALVQLEWTVLRLLAIAGALHERVERVVLYTAFFKNALAVDESPDAALFELPIDGADSQVARRERPMMRSDVETEVELPGWATPFLHIKVKKNEDGLATVDLRIADDAPQASQPG
jgi:hypothetical protein